MEYKADLHDKLITDFTALTYSDNKVCFADVQKLYISFPDGTPACQILATEPRVDQSELHFDQRSYGFSSIVSEFIETNSSQSDVDVKIDRLSDIEDVVLNYLEAIPNNLEDVVSGLRVVAVDVGSARYSYEDAENGLRVYQIIDFTARVSVNVHNL